MTMEGDELLAALLSGRMRRAALGADVRRWMDLAQAAGRSGLAGAVRARLGGGGSVGRRALDEAHCPDAFCTRLARFATLAAANHLNAMGELERLLAAFNESGVEVMLLKGAALNLTLYGRPDERPMGDVDLLVRPADFASAELVLESCGCRRGVHLVREDWVPRFYYEAEYISPPPRNVRIDLHVRPLRPLRVSRTMPDEALWDGARRVAVGASFAYVPRREYMLLHLAAHAAFHGFSRLMWVHDLHRLIECHQRTLDCDLLVRRARDWGLTAGVREALHRATDWFATPIPAAVLSRLDAVRVPWGERLATWHAPRDARCALAAVVVNLACTPGLRFRAAYLAALARPDASHLASIYRCRHRGWRAMAHAWRLVRVPVRLLAAGFTWPWIRGLAMTRRLCTGRVGRQRVRTGASAIHGTGVFAERAFASGEVIGAYSARRADESNPFAVKRITKARGERWLELKPPFRYLNHSHRPNAQLSRHSSVVRAIGPIARGSEITIDYGACLVPCTTCGGEHLVSGKA